MIVSFKIEQAEDLDLLLRITKRLNIERVDNPSIHQSMPKNLLEEGDTISVNEINNDIASIFGDDIDSPLPFSL